MSPPPPPRLYTQKYINSIENCVNNHASIATVDISNANKFILIVQYSTILMLFMVFISKHIIITSAILTKFTYHVLVSISYLKIPGSYTKCILQLVLLSVSLH